VIEPYLNPRLRAPRATGSQATTAASSDRKVAAFHRSYAGYRPTALRQLDSLARELGIGTLLVKDESSRLGLPAFKILGASWAIRRALGERLGIDPDAPLSFDELRARAGALAPMSLAAATDGNHGRAVARVARMLGFGCRIFIPVGTATARIEAIAQEGAEVTIVEGGYGSAVAVSAKLAGDRCLVISDTSWAGYETVPRWVIDGYATILDEVPDQLVEQGIPAPHLVFVQIGVGAFAAAVVRRRFGHERGLSRTVGVEPTNAACVLESLRAGRVITLDGNQDSIMAGLNCGTPSLIAWPEIESGLDASLTVSDERAREAMRMLASEGVVAGESGAAGVAGLVELLHGEGLERIRSELSVDHETRALVFCTEGATDPRAYREILTTAG
jgi:diaminopropionate ammonia-lyase